MPSFSKHVQQAQERPRFFLALTITWCVIMLTVAIVAFLVLDTQIEFFGMQASLSQVVIAAQLLWLAASFRVLLVNEVGAIVLYGLPLIRVRRGPKLIIFGLLQLQRFPASVIQNQFPADPELIQKTDDKEPLQQIEIEQPDGTTVQKMKVRPIRITTAKPKDELGEDDILNVQMTVEFTFWVRWIIDDPFEFIINAGGEIESAVRQMRDSGESLLNREVTKRTPSELISEFDMLQIALGKEITKQLMSWGIAIIDVGMTAPDINHEVAAELRNIPKARASAVQVRVNAEAENYRLYQEGQGRGKAREEELAGEGRGYKRAGKFIGTSAETMLTAQVARETVGEADLVLGTEGIAQAVGLGKKILERKTNDGASS